MTPDLVADVGNSRVKWGRCNAGRVCETASLPNDFDYWEKQYSAWNVSAKARWGVCGVHPLRLDALTEWLRKRGHCVSVLDSAQKVPIRVGLTQPERVGIDRLVNAVAARQRCAASPAIIVDAGSAVTVDLLDEAGIFAGGAIFPGAALMAKALHDYTALLPLVSLGLQPPALPAKSTQAALEAGIFLALGGGVRSLVEALASSLRGRFEVFLTGGDANVIARSLPMAATLWPEMTLEGIRLSTESLPDE